MNRNSISTPCQDTQGKLSLWPGLGAPLSSASTEPGVGWLALLAATEVQGRRAPAMPASPGQAAKVSGMVSSAPRCCPPLDPFLAEQRMPLLLGPLQWLRGEHCQQSTHPWSRKAGVAGVLHRNKTKNQRRPQRTLEKTSSVRAEGCLATSLTADSDTCCEERDRVIFDGWSGGNAKLRPHDGKEPGEQEHKRKALYVGDR